MSALEERTRLYEILLRFDAAGRPFAIQRRIHEVLRGGEVIAASELAAEPIDPAGVRELMSASLASLLAENLRLRAALTPDQRRALDLPEPLIAS
jgi:hypothetical protein